MPLKNAFEMFIKIFNSQRPQLVKDASHLDPIIGVRIATILGSDQEPITLLTGCSQFRSIVMAITQHEANFSGYLPQQFSRWVTTADLIRRDHTAHGKPNTPHPAHHI